ncbi:MAG: ferredoxin [Acidimicrobiaceae bacterium]|jgi:ferredoxin
MEISIDSAACTGHGLCYSLAPHLVTDDERGRGQVMVGSVPADEVVNAKAARANCPEQAVLLSE